MNTLQPPVHSQDPGKQLVTMHAAKPTSTNDQNIWEQYPKSSNIPDIYNEKVLTFMDVVCGRIDFFQYKRE